jgi:hypothetical protein
MVLRLLRNVILKLLCGYFVVIFGRDEWHSSICNRWMNSIRPSTTVDE